MEAEKMRKRKQRLKKMEGKWRDEVEITGELKVGDYFKLNLGSYQRLSTLTFLLMYMSFPVFVLHNSQRGI